MEPLTWPEGLVTFKIRGTWLSRKPRIEGALAFALATLALVIGSILSWSNFHGLEALMAASPQAVFKDHEYWRLFTSLFVHGDGKHLLSNVFLFFILGSLLAGYFGTFLVPVSGFLAGALVNWFALKNLGPTTELIGASGIVFWLGGAWLALYALLDRTRSLGQRSVRAFGVALALFMPAEAFDPNISYQSHLLGFTFGVIWGIALFWLYRHHFRSAERLEAVFEET